MASDRLARILDQLPPDEATYLGALLPAWAQRDLRLARRDAAVVEAFAMAAPMLPKPASRRIADTLNRYLGSGSWAADRRRAHSPSADRFRDAIIRIARANEGKPLGYRRLLYILDEHRAADKVQKNPMESAPVSPDV